MIFHCLRLLNRAIPLGHRYNPLLSRLFGNAASIRVPWGKGFFLSIPGEWLRLPSSASAPIYNTPRRQNPEFFHILADQCPRNAEELIVDVGANMGTYVINFRSVTAASILAYEPNPAIHELLARNVSDNHLARVTTRMVACADRAGTLTFEVSLNGSVVPFPDPSRDPGAPGATELIKVPAVRLDDELADKQGVALIKIDCEGFEYHVLRGAMETIERLRPTLFIELHPKFIGAFGHSLEEICSLLRPYYSMAFWDAGRGMRQNSRLPRVLSRFRMSWQPFDRCLEPFHNETEMLAIVNGSEVPDQVFMLATALPPGA